MSSLDCKRIPDVNTSKRKRMSSEDRREQILDIAHAIIDAEGFYAATPNRIAETAGITRAVLYQQFGDISRLYVELVGREAQRAAQQFAEAVAQGRKPADARPFAAVFDGVLRAVDAHPATWRLFLIPPEGAPPELHQRLAEAQAIVRQFLEGELRRAYPKLKDPEYTARIIQAGGRELLQLRLRDPEAATTERLLLLLQSFRSWLAAPR